MFGYVRPYKPELLVKELTRYQSVYCGICKQIGRDYGQLPRLALGYDLTLFAVLLLSLTPDQPPEEMAGCISNPVKKRPMLKGGEIIRLAAGLTVLLAYHKAADNARDEHPVLGRSVQLALAQAYRKAARRYPAYEQAIRLHLGRLHELEKGPSDLAASDQFGRLLETFLAEAAPLASPDPAIQAGLSRFGYHLGSWIYLLDAIDDRESDCNNGSWNPFSTLEPAAAQEKARTLLEQHEMEMDRVAALLPYDRDAGLMGNIVTVGLLAARDTILAGRRLGKI
ncbi:MAG: hypothetical protein EOM08_05905 [Clostridia bacterium]|nr:hypothetical protein [Clostridia bacterium]